MKNRFLIASLLVIALSSCTATDLRKAVGVEKDAPDEFLVLPREKLVIPTSAVTLATPTKKEAGHIAASERGHEAVFGKAPAVNREKSVAEKTLLAKAKAENADSKIRDKVEDEYEDKTGVFGTDRGGTMESILDPFGYNAPKEPIVDAKAENKRIKEALRKGEKIDPAAVKTKDPTNKEKVKKEGVI